jgi:hypothetical protein
MAAERGETSESNLCFCGLMVDSENRKWSKRVNAAECINAEAKACFFGKSKTYLLLFTYNLFNSDVG